ncbi:MAG: class I SAM-dependent methyltransferase [Myxococcales bacterium]
MRALVTTAPSGSPEEADELARRFGLTAEPRADRLVPELLEAAQGAPVLVLGSRRADLFDGGRVFRASIGMGYLRFVRMRGGEGDPLITAAKLMAGDRVLDATLGLAQDALVAAEVTGEAVEGLEASPVLAAFVVAALRRLPSTAAREAAARISVRCADHRAALKELPAKSFDVVLLDPMFRTAADSNPLFDLLRRHGEHAPVDAQTLKAAQRVARRGVLVKDAAPGAELTRLDLVPLPSRRTARIVFGWAPAE